ncbi:YwqG family protein [Bacillus rhizoplanae]|uniref:YwqG family protein n=1 Tax=Bacillus rhizoplanae TaxID=2880966 RepID=UPI003D20D264
MAKHIEELIEKYQLTHIKDELLATAFECIKVVPKQEAVLPVGCSKMGGCPDLPATLDYPTYKEHPLHFVAQVNLAELQAVGMKNDLPQSGMLYFFYFADDEQEAFCKVYGNPNVKEGWRVLYYDGEIDDVQKTNQVKGQYTQCRVTFEIAQKLPDLFIEDEDDSDRFLQLLEELIPDCYDNHQVFGTPFSVQTEVLEEAQEYIGVHHNDITLLFQVDSDEEHLNMMWGDMGMLYFCIANEDVKQRRFEKACCILQSL